MSWSHPIKHLLDSPNDRFPAASRHMRHDGLVSQRARILRLALELMAQGGAEAMSMRDLAGAAEMNVATLYHYFPSKRDLLTAVLEEPEYRNVLDGELPGAGPGGPVDDLAQLLQQSWQVMLDVQDYVRVMVGEALRNDDAARSVGSGLLGTTEAGLQQWAADVLHERQPARAAAIARMLRAVIVGVFIEQLADGSEDTSWCEQRARELAPMLAGVVRREGGAPRSTHRR